MTGGRQINTEWRWVAQSSSQLNKLSPSDSQDQPSSSSYCSMATPIVPQVKLGNQGLKVSKLGYGCMGLTGVYNNPVSDEDGISIIKQAFEKGITFFDTADVYGSNTNEILVGKALKYLPREKVQLATKFGIVFTDGKMDAKGSPEYVRKCCEASLKRLDVDYIDLYYQHRVDTTIPIEETLGIGIVPYSPLGRGFFSGKAVVESLPENSFLGAHPRFKGENFEKNKIFHTRIADLAKRHGCTPGQLSLAWVLHQGDDVVPIPGTTKIKNLDENVGSLNVNLSQQDLEEISSSLPVDEVAGLRTYEYMYHKSWKFADTPPK